MKKDSLEIMLALQKDLEALFYDPSSLDLEDQQNWTKEHIIAILAECGELLETINWKHWKKPTPVHREEVLKELVDLLHFVLAIAVVWNFGVPDILDEYIKKNVINFQRQKEGY